MLANALRLDPTRLTALRRQYVAAIEARFTRLAKAIWQSVVVQDDYGLVNPDITLQDIVSRPITNAGAYKFETDAGKVAAYQAWLQQQIDTGLVTSSNAGGQFGATYLNSAYKAGIIRGWQEANPNKASRILPDTGGTFGQFANESFGLPVRATNVEMIYTRSYTKLKGYTAQMAADTSSTMADALTRGLGAKDTARALVAQVGLAKSKALRLARTELTAAHADGQLDSYAEAGVRQVDVLAEWATAGDNRVCSMCSALNGFIITVAQARGLIPRHPNCRCAWKPVINTGKTSKKILGTDQLDAIKKSIAAEGRKGDKSTWAGAEVTPKDIKQLTLVEEQQAAAARRAAALRKTLGLGDAPPPPPPVVPPPKPTPPPKPKPKPKPVPKPAPAAKVPKPPKPIKFETVYSTKDAKPKPAVQTPAHMTFSGTRTSLTDAVHTRVAQGMGTAADVKAVGKLMREDILATAKSTTGRPVGQVLEEWGKAERAMEVNSKEFYRLLDQGDAKRGPAGTAKMNKLFEESKGLRQAVRDLRAEVPSNMEEIVAGKLRQIRDYREVAINHTPGSNASAISDAKAATGKLPYDWMQTYADYSKKYPIRSEVVDRGFFNGAENKLMTSGGDDVADRIQVMRHELGHAAEYMSQYVVASRPSPKNIGKLQREFLDSRIKKGEKPTRIYPNSRDPKVMREVGYKDDFLEHYMGKEYNSSTHFEILTMGVERITDERCMELMAMDPDYFDFVIGLMCGV